MIRSIGVALLLAGCGGGHPEYDIALDLPSDAVTDDVVRVEIDVVRRGCDQVPENGGTIAPSEIVRPLGWTMDEATSDVGDLVPGAYGFAARMRRVDCSVSYAGCAEKTIAEDGEGSISIALQAVEGATCLPTETCTGDGGCIAPES